MKKRWSVYLMAALYLLAGFNHFRNPEMYKAIIPPMLGDTHQINVLAGIAEILLALLLIPVRTRKWACYGIILMLLAFLPTHIYMLQDDFVFRGSPIPAWILWLRLLLFQPLLILWAWFNSKVK